jgi:hypothetical protein
MTDHEIVMLVRSYIRYVYDDALKKYYVPYVSPQITDEPSAESKFNTAVEKFNEAVEAREIVEKVHDTLDKMDHRNRSVIVWVDIDARHNGKENLLRIAYEHNLSDITLKRYLHESRLQFASIIGIHNLVKKEAA